MALNLIMPHEHIPVNAIKLSIYSDPSCGKSTLGMQGEGILHLDADLGTHRVDYPLRRSPIQRVDVWEQLMTINQKDLEPYSIIVMDTAQRVLESIRTHLAKDRKNVVASTGSLKLQVQQQANNIFQTFNNKLISWNKDVVYLSHMIEVKSEDDKTSYRCPDIGGKNKQEIYRMADCMAYMTWAGTPDNPNRRLLRFSTGDASYHSKDCANLGDIEIPDLMHNPSFLSDLIKRIKAKLNDMSPEQREQIRTDQEWQHWLKVCHEAKYASEFNSLTQEMQHYKENPHYKNMWSALKQCGGDLGLVYDKNSLRWSETVEA